MKHILKSKTSGFVAIISAFLIPLILLIVKYYQYQSTHNQLEANIGGLANNVALIVAKNFNPSNSFNDYQDKLETIARNTAASIYNTKFNSNITFNEDELKLDFDSKNRILICVIQKTDIPYTDSSLMGQELKAHINQVGKVKFPPNPHINLAIAFPTNDNSYGIYYVICDLLKRYSFNPEKFFIGIVPYSANLGVLDKKKYGAQECPKITEFDNISEIMLNDLLVSNNSAESSQFFSPFYDKYGIASLAGDYDLTGSDADPAEPQASTSPSDLYMLNLNPGNLMSMRYLAKIFNPPSTPPYVDVSPIMEITTPQEMQKIFFENLTNSGLQNESVSTFLFLPCVWCRCILTEDWARSSQNEGNPKFDNLFKTSQKAAIIIANKNSIFSKDESTYLGYSYGSAKTSLEGSYCWNEDQIKIENNSYQSEIKHEFYENNNIGQHKFSFPKDKNIRYVKITVEPIHKPITLLETETPENKTTQIDITPTPGLFKYTSPTKSSDIINSIKLQGIYLYKIKASNTQGKIFKYPYNAATSCKYTTKQIQDKSPIGDNYKFNTAHAMQFNLTNYPIPYSEMIFITDSKKYCYEFFLNQQYTNVSIESDISEISCTCLPINAEDDEYKFEMPVNKYEIWMETPESTIMLSYNDRGTIIQKPYTLKEPRTFFIKKDELQTEVADGKEINYLLLTTQNIKVNCVEVRMQDAEFIEYMPYQKTKTYYNNVDIPVVTQKGTSNLEITKNEFLDIIPTNHSLKTDLINQPYLCVQPSGILLIKTKDPTILEDDIEIFAEIVPISKASIKFFKYNDTTKEWDPFGTAHEFSDSTTTITLDTKDCIPYDNQTGEKKLKYELTNCAIESIQTTNSSGRGILQNKTPLPWDYGLSLECKDSAIETKKYASDYTQTLQPETSFPMPTENLIFLCSATIKSGNLNQFGSFMASYKDKTIPHFIRSDFKSNFSAVLPQLYYVHSSSANKCTIKKDINGSNFICFYGKFEHLTIKLTKTSNTQNPTNQCQPPICGEIISPTTYKIICNKCGQSEVFRVCDVDSVRCGMNCSGKPICPKCNSTTIVKTTQEEYAAGKAIGVECYCEYCHQQYVKCRNCDKPPYNKSTKINSPTFLEIDVPNGFDNTYKQGIICDTCGRNTWYFLVNDQQCSRCQLYHHNDGNGCILYSTDDLHLYYYQSHILCNQCMTPMVCQKCNSFLCRATLQEFYDKQAIGVYCKCGTSDHHDDKVLNKLPIKCPKCITPQLRIEYLKEFSTTLDVKDVKLVSALTVEKLNDSSLSENFYRHILDINDLEICDTAQQNDGSQKITLNAKIRTNESDYIPDALVTIGLTTQTLSQLEDSSNKYNNTSKAESSVMTKRISDSAMFVVLPYYYDNSAEFTETYKRHYSVYNILGGNGILVNCPQGKKYTIHAKCIKGAGGDYKAWFGYLSDKTFFTETWWVYHIFADNTTDKNSCYKGTFSYSSKFQVSCILGVFCAAGSAEIDTIVSTEELPKYIKLFKSSNANLFNIPLGENEIIGCTNCQYNNDKIEPTTISTTDYSKTYKKTFTFSIQLKDMYDSMIGVKKIMYEAKNIKITKVEVNNQQANISYSGNKINYDFATTMNTKKYTDQNNLLYYKEPEWQNTSEISSSNTNKFACFANINGKYYICYYGGATKITVTAECIVPITKAASSQMTSYALNEVTGAQYNTKIWSVSGCVYDSGTSAKCINIPVNKTFTLGPDTRIISAVSKKTKEGAWEKATITSLGGNNYKIIATPPPYKNAFSTVESKKKLLLTFQQDYSKIQPHEEISPRDYTMSAPTGSFAKSIKIGEISQNFTEKYIKITIPKEKVTTDGIKIEAPNDCALNVYRINTFVKKPENQINNNEVRKSENADLAIMPSSQPIWDPETQNYKIPNKSYITIQKPGDFAISNTTLESSSTKIKANNLSTYLPQEFWHFNLTKDETLKCSKEDNIQYMEWIKTNTIPEPTLKPSEIPSVYNLDKNQLTVEELNQIQTTYNCKIAGFSYQNNGYFGQTSSLINITQIPEPNSEQIVFYIITLTNYGTPIQYTSKSQTKPILHGFNRIIATNDLSMICNPYIRLHSIQFIKHRDDGAYNPIIMQNGGSLQTLTSNTYQQLCKKIDYLYIITSKQCTEFDSLTSKDCIIKNYKFDNKNQLQNILEDILEDLQTNTIVKPQIVL